MIKKVIKKIPPSYPNFIEELTPSTQVRAHTHTHIHPYKYIYMCVCIYIYIYIGPNIYFYKLLKKVQSLVQTGERITKCTKCGKSRVSIITK